MIVFVYVMIMLGKFNCLEMRSYLAFAGILGVIMGIIVSYGFCSAINLFFGPMHSVLPFLLLGIGIDDMFVIGKFIIFFYTIWRNHKRLKPRNEV